MKKIVFLFIIISASLSAQEFVLSKATMQTINQGASPSSVTTYSILLEKKEKFCWKIDSVCGIESMQRVKYNLVKVDDPDVLSPNYKPVTTFSKSDTGKYLITFSITKQHSGGRPGAPQNMKADTTNIEGGVYVYYKAGKKHKKLKVESFEMLETVNAP